VGIPETTGSYRHAFGGDGTGLGIDLAETHALLDRFAELGIGLVSTTAGSPYYNPHVQRPAYFPPSDGYQPPEDPLVGVARQLAVTAELAAAHRDLAIVGSGYSYLQDWLAHVGQAVVGAGGAAMVGLGRVSLSYPSIAADVLAGRSLDRGSICRTFSDCTTAPRHGLVSGCYPLDPFYKDHPQRVELARVKRAAKARLR
jgi:2,4-dienoyl-CoA reductase-like NADH-dependent reductase (Old Yellow Enzyme family)